MFADQIDSAGGADDPTGRLTETLGELGDDVGFFDRHGLDS